MPDRRDFIAIFKTEAADYLAYLDKGIVELERRPGDQDLLKELNRQAHSLKGSARVMGYRHIESIAHRLEDIFELIGQKKLDFSTALADKIFKGLDKIRFILEEIAKDESADIDVSGVCAELDGSGQMVSSAIQDVPAGGTAEPVKTQPAQASAVSAASHGVEEYIRVPVVRVNKLLNLVGELVIYKMKSAQNITQLRRACGLIKNMQKDIFEFHEELKKTSLPAPQAEALFGRCQADIQKAREDALSLYDSLSNEIFHLDPVIDELQSKTKELRMLPCATIFEGFSRMVRDIAHEVGKEVNLEIKGAETELDRKVLESLKAPLIHILRNSIDHGIEDPERRRLLGKPKEGSIKLSAFQEAGNVLITVEDDGGGIDTEEVKRTAVNKRLVSSKDLEIMTEKEVLNIIFMSGYSTSRMITDVSGRGIGLDVARRDIENLKGVCQLTTQKDKGTKFTLILPLTIAILDALLVKVKGGTFALPVISLEEALYCHRAAVSTVEGRMAVLVRERIVPLVGLDEVLGLSGESLRPQAGSKDLNEVLAVVIVSSLGKWIGFVVEEIIGQEEIFIKSLGRHLGKAANASGASILGTGEVVIVLDVSDLIKHSRLEHPAISGFGQLPPRPKEKKRILVVEDTLTTRELEKSILEMAGYEVEAAVDGLDALERIAQADFHLVVCDVQMPRMDGFELCASLRRDERHKDLPVVFVTSLEKEQDKRRGLEVGAQAYIVKSAFNQDNLLTAIERLIL